MPFLDNCHIKTNQYRQWPPRHEDQTRPNGQSAWQEHDFLVWIYVLLCNTIVCNLSSGSSISIMLILLQQCFFLFQNMAAAAAVIHNMIGSVFLQYTIFFMLLLFFLFGSLFFFVGGGDGVMVGCASVLSSNSSSLCHGLW